MIEQQPRVTMDTAILEAVVARARRVLLSTQRADGSWNTESDSGVTCTAEVLIVLRYIDALASDDAAEAARWIRAQQRSNGSFVRYPFAEAGDVTTTALARAALISAGAPATDPVVERAHRFVEAHGGRAAALDQFRRGDLAPIFLAIAGQIPASRFPSPPLAFSLVPPLMRLLERRFHAGILMMTLEIGVLLRRLRGDWGPDGTRKGPIATKACQRTLALLDTFQNLEGSFDAETMITALGIAALHAIGIPNSDPRLVKALAWLRQRRQRDHAGAWFSSFQGPVWSTAFDVRALLASGLFATDPHIAQALAWLADAQILIPQPAVNNTHAGAPRVGGYAFQPTNETMPDCDDAGVVLSAFGLALAQGVSADVQGRITHASRLAQEWLFGMQNPDGGWPAFVYGLPPKPPGPIFTKPVALSPDDPAALLRAFLHPPPELGDPSTEDVTGRVLLGLGRHGHTTREEAIGRAAEFLRAQQCPSGAWWGRWTNYVSSTAFVLLGLASVQADLRAAWVRRGVQWLRSMQNDDGGWSDNPAAYADPALAGRGHSMPPLTALVVTMLVEIGEGDSDTAARAVRYLLEQQRADGTWLNGDYLHTYIPPDTHYYYSDAARFYPLEALGRYLAHCGAGARADDAGPDRYTDSLLVTMRRVADPVADEVVQALFDRGEVGAANAIFQAMSAPTIRCRSDCPTSPCTTSSGPRRCRRGRTRSRWPSRRRFSSARAGMWRWRSSARLCRRRTRRGTARSSSSRRRR